MFNQEDEIDLFFREQERSSEKKEPEQRPDDGLPSIMRALDERPKDEFQPAAFPTGGFASTQVADDTFFQEQPKEYRGFHDSGTARYDRNKEMEAQLEHDERISRCGILAKKYMQMFLILIGGIALRIVMVILAGLASINKDLVIGASVVIIVLAVASVVIAVLYGVILIGLGRYDLEFKSAGLFYMVAGACDALNSCSSGVASLAFSIIGAVFSVLYVLKFAVAMSNTFDNVASYMAVSWETFKKVAKYVYSGIFICTLLCFFPILNILAIIVLFFLSIGAIVVSIWQIVLIYRSSNVMKQYSTVIRT